MPSIKRISDLNDYKSVLPYASELFGVYQPLIGWKSKRIRDRIRRGVLEETRTLLSRLGKFLATDTTITFNNDCSISATDLRPATFAGPRLIGHESIILQAVTSRLRAESKVPPDTAAWRRILDADFLTKLLGTAVVQSNNQIAIEHCRQIASFELRSETRREPSLRQAELRAEHQRTIVRNISDEAAIAGVLLILAREGYTKELSRIFYADLEIDSRKAFFEALRKADADFQDPYLTFDPRNGVQDVSLSPLGIVHLYRQYFFELDSFLGTPTGHVWLSPGATVELIEVSTRRTITEKTFEVALEKVVKSEKSTTEQDELAEAVKQDNKDDLKLGVTATVNQSWCTGNASATASLNMDKTQQVARETTHKKMRQQTEKLSSEIRENYKSTFKTTTEATDMSSKRYVLTNTTQNLINYELRRKMRQVAVQVQDIGSFLCWETFVDEPGANLGLATLVHLAQPPDLLPVPDQTEIPYPTDRIVAFQTNAVWNFGDDRKHGFVTLTSLDPPPPPEGFEVARVPDVIPVTQISGNGEDFTGAWGFGARFTSSGQLEIGVVTGSDGLEWNKRVDFVLGGALTYTATATKKAEIDNANKTKKTLANDASLANDRKTKEIFVKAVKERIEQAGAITRRAYEDLREEERIIVYRKLLESLMTSYNYQHADDRSRHVLSELINSIFDIDKMLYFVAPEWWKPRSHPREFLSLRNLQRGLAGSLVTWSDARPRPANYLITEKSAPAVLGSSLGWLLQLDGDNLRNAFLNAPWVKAVIPIRPGKEKAASSWLQNVQVEGADGLDAAYAAPDSELNKIRHDQGLPGTHIVTIKDAIESLCMEVAAKHEEANKVKKYPDEEVEDDNKVNSTPVEKVYEHGFYPLKGGFRISPTAGDPDPNNADRHFQVFDQWLEVLPTEQVVPVEVKYDAKTGRQV